MERTDQMGVQIDERPIQITPIELGAVGFRQRIRARWRDEGGQAVVEFALVFPLLLLVLTAILQFGVMYNKYITLTDAVRVGVRTLALGRNLDDPCDPAVLQTVNSAFNTGLTASQVTATLSSPDNCGSGSYPSRTGGYEVQGDQATVTASEPYSFSVFGMSLFNLNLSASASQAIE